MGLVFSRSANLIYCDVGSFWSREVHFLGLTVLSSFPDWARAPGIVYEIQLLILERWVLGRCKARSGRSVLVGFESAVDRVAISCHALRISFQIRYIIRDRLRKAHAVIYNVRIYPLGKN